MTDDSNAVIAALRDELAARQRRIEQLEEELADVRHRMRGVVEQAPIPVLLHAEDGTILGISRTLLESTGYAADELRTVSDWTSRAFGEEGPLVLAGIDRLYAADRRVDEGDFQVRTRSGALRNWRFASAPLGIGRQGKRLVLSMATDLTELKLAEAALRESEQRLQLAQTVTGTGAWDLDLRTGDAVWSRQMYELLGLDPAEPATSARFFECVHPEDIERLRARFERAIEARGVFDEEFRILRPDGSVVHVLGRGQVVAEEGGEPVRMIGVNADVSRHKLAEDALRLADRRKEEFIAVLSHELRNPLAPIRSAIELLDGAHGDAGRLGELRAMMQRQVGLLMRLVDDLLDISRINQGRIDLQLEHLDMNDPVRIAIEQVRPLIERREHVLETTLTGQALPVEGDPARLTQVVANLLSNAATFMEPGGSISLATARDGDQVLLRVRDRGYGIPPQHLEDLFRIFSQVPEHVERGAGGLGIGLSLARQLIVAQGGDIEAASAGLGQGSEFTLRLPLRPIAPVAAGASGQPRSAASPCRILVVDDNVDAADALAMLLRRDGHEVEVRYDGPDGLLAVQAFDPRVVLLDIGLPGMDGVEVAERIRAECGPAHPYLVAVTGWGKDQDKARTRSAGFDYHMTKPVDLAQLTMVIARGAAGPGSGG